MYKLTNEDKTLIRHVNEGTWRMIMFFDTYIPAQNRTKIHSVLKENKPFTYYPEGYGRKQTITPKKLWTVWAKAKRPLFTERYINLWLRYHELKGNG